MYGGVRPVSMKKATVSRRSGGSAASRRAIRYRTRGKAGQRDGAPGGSGNEKAPLNRTSCSL